MLRLSSQHDQGGTDVYNHLTSMRIFTMIINKMFIRAPKITRHNLDSLIISHELCFLYPTRNGWRDQKQSKKRINKTNNGQWNVNANPSGHLAQESLQCMVRVYCLPCKESNHLRHTVYLTLPYLILVWTGSPSAPTSLFLHLRRRRNLFVHITYWISFSWMQNFFNLKKNLTIGRCMIR